MRKKIELELKNTQLNILRDKLNIITVSLLKRHHVSSDLNSLKNDLVQLHNKAVHLGNNIDLHKSIYYRYTFLLIISLSLFIIGGIMISFEKITILGYFICFFSVLTGYKFFFKKREIYTFLDKLQEDRSLLNDVLCKTEIEHEEILEKINLLKDKERYINIIIEIEKDKADLENC